MFALFLLFSSVVVADAEMLYPVSSVLKAGSTVQIGSVSPGQVFEVIFSDDSGFGFEWSKIIVDRASLPTGWVVLSEESTDASLVVAIKVPEGAKPNFYLITIGFSNPFEPGFDESVKASVVVKHSLVDVAFTRITEEGSVVGEDVVYRVSISNASIAPYAIDVTSTLPSNWFDGKTIEAKPNASEEFDLVVKPLVYGKNNFSFKAVTKEDNLVAGSFSSDLNVKPTLKGKFSSVLTGFPFFTFSLTPFQAINSLISFVIPN